MIKSITFEELTSQRQIRLDFKKHNVIVGQRGGGKSTLLNILYQLCNYGSVSKNSELLMNQWGWTIKECHFENKSKAEPVLLNKNNFANNSRFWKDWNDCNYIIQSDPRKQNVSEMIWQQAQQKIKVIARELITNDISLINIIEQLSTIGDKFNDCRQLNMQLNQLDWAFISEIKLSDINSSYSIEKVINHAGDNWSKYKKVENNHTKDIDNMLLNLVALKPSRWTNVDETNQLISQLKTQLTTHKKRIEQCDKFYLDLINRLLNFNKNYKKTLSEQNQKNNFKNDSINLIKTFSYQMFELKKLIQQFIKEDLMLKLDIKMIDQSDLVDFKIRFDNNQEVSTLQIKKETKINWLKNLFKKSPPNQTNAIAWIKANLDQVLNQNWEEQVIKGLEQTISPALEVAIKYDQKWINHNHLSGGQKTTYGLKKLLQQRDFNMPLFIDQPEEDFDAKTMSEYLSEQLFGKNVFNQSFVVSHMAPLIGNNLDELNFIKADFNDQLLPYVIIKNPQTIEELLEGSDLNFNNRRRFYKIKSLKE